MSNTTNFSRSIQNNEKINIRNTNYNNEKLLNENQLISNGNGNNNNNNIERIKNNANERKTKKTKETQPLYFGLGLAMDALIKFAYAPVERLQILQQVQPVIPEIHNRPSYLHITSAFKTIIKEQGVESLWRGATVGLIRFIPSHINNYIIECYDSINHTKKKESYNSKYRNSSGNSNNSHHRRHHSNKHRQIISKNEIINQNTFKKEMDNNNNNVNNVNNNENNRTIVPIINTLKWLNGKSNLSVAVTMALGYPLNLIRVRLAADVGSGQSRKYKSITDCFGHIYHQGGLMCMYQGWIESYLAYILYNFTVKTAYKQSMNYLYGKNMTRPPLWKQWFIGQLITRSAYIFIYPLETIKLRMMMQAGDRNLRYRHGWECLWRIIRDEGLLSLYKGIDVVLLSEIFGWGVILSSGVIMDWLVGKLIGTNKKTKNHRSFSYELTRSESSSSSLSSNQRYN